MPKYKIINNVNLSAGRVWGLLMILTITYGIILAGIEYGSSLFTVINQGLLTIYTSSAVLMHDYFAMVGIGPAFVISGMAGLTALIAFKFAKMPIGGLQMGVFGLVMGFALLGKNPFNMLPFYVGAYLYSRFKNEPFKKNVTMAGFASCLAPVVNQPAHMPEVANLVGSLGGVFIGALLGIFIGFVVNSKAGFIKKSHEGLNLYNIGWGAGLISIALTVVYAAIGIQRFGPRFTWETAYASAAGVAGVYTPPSSFTLSGPNYNTELFIFLIWITVFFFVFGLLTGGKLNKLREILYMKADDNVFFDKYGQGHTYLAMGCLGLLALIITGTLQVHLTAGIIGAILSMIGWGGFGKAVANSAAIIAGVMLGGIVKYLIHPDFFAVQAPFFEYLSVQDVIWTSAFWGTCLSPMARHFGWKWALLIGMVHFAFASTIAPFHWGQNLYNNGLAAGFVCVVMIPVIRAFDRKGKYPTRKV